MLMIQYLQEGSRVSDEMRTEVESAAPVEGLTSSSWSSEER